MTKKANLPPFLLEDSSSEKQVHNIWPATLFTLRRNLRHSFFPAKLSTLERESLLESLKKALFSLKEINHPISLPASTLGAFEKEFISERFLFLTRFPNELHQNELILDSDMELLIQLNGEDHLEIQLINYNGNWDTSYQHLTQIETSLGSILNFAFNERFGFLTSNPSLSGTALVVNTLLHLPALIHTGQLPVVLEKTLQPYLSLTSLEGDKNVFMGDFLILSNSYTLGLSEEEILHAVKSSSEQLVAAEQASRTHLIQQPNLSIKDLVSKAYGLLKYSYLLHINETLNALSLMKLALHLNWISALTDQKINELLLKCQQAHLSYLHNLTSSDETELARLRALFLRTHLKEAQLEIT